MEFVAHWTFSSRQGTLLCETQVPMKTAKHGNKCQARNHVRQKMFVEGLI